MQFLFFMKPISMRVQFASNQDFVFSFCNERTVQSPVFLCLIPKHSHVPGKKKQPQLEAKSLFWFPLRFATILLLNQLSHDPSIFTESPARIQ